MRDRQVSFTKKSLTNSNCLSLTDEARLREEWVIVALTISPNSFYVQVLVVRPLLFGRGVKLVLWSTTTVQYRWYSTVEPTVGYAHLHWPTRGQLVFFSEYCSLRLVYGTKYQVLYLLTS
jgi:hypothetical protein